MVRGDVMPFREDLASISEDLATLSKVGWIAMWRHPEQGQMGHIVNWSKHQKIDHPSKSKLETYDIRETLAKESRDTRETLALDQGSRIKDQGSRIKENEGGKSKRFLDPSVEDVAAYCSERGNGVDPSKFVDFYASKGWMVGKNKMKDWKAAVRTWEANNPPKKSSLHYDDDPNMEQVLEMQARTKHAKPWHLEGIEGP
jgi:hypothetical protein